MQNIKTGGIMENNTIENAELKRIKYKLSMLICFVIISITLLLTVLVSFNSYTDGLIRTLNVDSGGIQSEFESYKQRAKFTYDDYEIILNDQ